MPNGSSRRIAPVMRLAVLIAGCGLVVGIFTLACMSPAFAAPARGSSPSGEDDWQFEAEYAKANKNKAPGMGAAPGGGSGKRLAARAPMAAPAGQMSTLGLSAGGAKDIANFRENIAKGFQPLPTDVTYEGLYYDYFFETGGACADNTLFCPTYATAVSNDPFTGKPEYYLSVGLGSGVKAADFSRKKLNLMLVLDISGSMSAPFDKYYYDRFGSKSETPDQDRGKSKLAAASEALIALLDHLRPEDRFGLVLFDQYAYTALRLRPVGIRDMEAIKGHIRDLRPMGSTNLDAGLSLATGLIRETRGSDPGQYENRVVFMTDAMPNVGDTSDKSFLARIQDNAKDRIYATVIGIGVDFNTALTEKITKARGANTYSVHSPGEFRKRLDTEFDYLVTPLVFDLALDFQSAGFRIDTVFGSPEADAATGELMRVNTLFPSPTTEEGSRGGLILLRLQKTGDNPTIVLTAKYEDRSGERHRTTAKLDFRPNGEAYGSPSIRKGILLARYATLLRAWLDAAPGKDDGEASRQRSAGRQAEGQPELGDWERQSKNLRLTSGQRATFAQFRSYFQKEMGACQDGSLKRELDVLDALGQPRT
jgi:Ca-activated chloride channel family protein